MDCGVSLKDRKRSVDLFNVLGVQSVAEVVRHGRLRWFKHVEHKSGDDWVSDCRNVVVAGLRCAGRGRKIWRECVKDDMDELGLHSEWVVFRDMWRSLILSRKPSNKSRHLGFLMEDISFVKICEEQDSNLFIQILQNEKHVLHQLFPPVEECTLFPSPKGS